MNHLFETVWELHWFFAENEIPYVVIGGLAVQRWGEPRTTLDVDVTIAVPIERTESIIQLIVQQFEPRIQDHLQFAVKNRVLLVKASNGTNVDIALGMPGYEEELMKRAVDLEIEPGKSIRLCSPDDLLIHKAIAGRIQDRLDIDSILERTGDQLNVDYIRQWLKIFSELLETDEVVNRFEIPYSRWKQLNRTQ